MKKITSVLLIIALTVTMLSYNNMLLAEEHTDKEQSSNISDVDYGMPGVDFKPGEVLVQVKDGAGVLLGKKSSADVEGKKAFVDGNQYIIEEKLDEDDKKSDLVLVKGEDTEKLIEAFEDSEDVLYAQPNFIYHLDALSDGSEEPDIDYQWAIENKLNSGADAVDLRLRQTWDHAENSEVVVAVCDSGVDYTHPELQNVMWDEGLNYRTLTNLGGGAYGYNASGSGNRNNPMDYMGHGTHGAATIASEYNRQGIAGLSNDVRIMAVKLADANGTIYSSGAINAYHYIIEAKKAGVNVIAVNNSWSRGIYRSRCQDSLFCEQINLAEEEGIAAVFSAGNNKSDMDKFRLSDYKNAGTLYVGAMDSKGEMASFSNYGKKYVDIFAPGINILSATSLSSENTYMPGQYLPWLSDSNNLLYEDFSGSRSASVSGTVYYSASNSRSLGAGVVDENGFGDDNALRFHVPGNSNATSSAYIDITISVDTDEMNLPESSNVYFGCAVNSFSNATVYLQSEDGTRTIVEKKTSNYDSGWGIITREIDAQKLTENVDSSGNLTFAIKLVQSSGIKNDLDILIDNIGIGTEKSEYHYENGTSMAAPMVTGLVAILASKYPDRSIEEIVAMIKGSAQTKNSLQDYCSTGGYATADAYSNPDSLKPVINQAVNNENEIILQGYFFGNETGTVNIGGFDAIVKNWSDRQIQVELPGEITKSSYKEILITKADGLYSSEYFMVGSGERGYELMNAPQGNVKSLNEIDLAANDDLLMSIHTDVFSDDVTFQIYNKSDDTWTETDGPGKIYLAAEFGYNIKTASSKHKIFVLYRGDTSNPGMRLATFDTEKKQWTDIVDVSEIADNYSMICVYKGELYILGGKNTSNVYKVYPDTGNTYGTVPNMKQAGGEGKVVANEKYMFVNSYNNSTPNNIERFDGTGFTRGTYRNDTYRYGLDVTTAFPVDNGIFVIGGAREDDETDHIVDTFFVDENTLKGTLEENFTFNETSLTAVDSAITSDCVYIEGMCDELSSIKMGKIDLSDNDIGLQGADFISPDPPTESMVNVLGMRFQWNADKSALRFVSSIDSDNYKEIGFIINGTYGESTITNKQRTIKCLYRSILAAGKKIYPTVINEKSVYFFTYTVRDMDPDINSSWSVTPYAVTMEGTKIFGKTGSIANNQ